MMESSNPFLYNLIAEDCPEYRKHVDKAAVDISGFSSACKMQLNSRLAAGLDLYGWRQVVYTNGQSIAFVVANDCVAGRGLRYANLSPCPRDVYITYMPGDLVQMRDGREPSGDAFKWQISKKDNTFLVFHPPTWDALGNLINTSDGTTPNNCRLQHKAGNGYVSVISTRTIYPGEELLVPYGSKFTGDIRAWLRLNSTIDK